METLYYVKDIDYLLKNIYSNLLVDKGSIIIGVDHYLENKPSLMWGEDYNLDIVTLSVKQWEKLFLKNKFKNIHFWKKNIITVIPIINNFFIKITYLLGVSNIKK